MSTELTRDVVSRYFTNLEQGRLDDALALLDEAVEFELPQDQHNDVIPYLGKHIGVDAVRRAFGIRGETTETHDYRMLNLAADHDTAFAVIYTRAAATRTQQEYVIEDAHRLTVHDGRITSWKVFFDPNVEVAAFTADGSQRLRTAIAAADTSAASTALAEGADVDARDPATGLTPLMAAAGRAQPEMVRVLLAAGADVLTAEPRAGATALHKACQGGNVEVVRQLVEAGAFVDSVAPTTGHTPLMDALWYKAPDVAEYLLDRGAGLNLSTHYGFSMVEHFSYELDVNVVGKEQLIEADGHLQARKRADEAAIEAQPLMAATAAGDLDAVERLLAEGVEVDARYPKVNGFNDDHTPLLVAARDGHAEIVRLLLAADADVNAVEPTFGAVPLHKAVYNGHADIAAAIADVPGCDLDFQGATNGYSPLHDSVWHGYDDCARALLARGARRDLIGHDGKTPADIAAEVFGADHALTGALREEVA